MMRLSILVVALVALASAEPGYRRYSRPSYHPTTYKAHNSKSRPVYKSIHSGRKGGVYGKGHQTYGYHTSPSYGQPQTYGHVQKSYSKSQPQIYGHGQKSYSKSQPQTYGHGQKSYSKSQPQTYGHVQESYSNSQQRYGDSPQTYGVTQQTYGDSPQTYENTPERYGDTTPITPIPSNYAPIQPAAEPVIPVDDIREQPEESIPHSL